MFQRNGRAGYVLKPEALRYHEKDLLSKRTQHFFDVSVRVFGFIIIILFLFDHL